MTSQHMRTEIATVTEVSAVEGRNGPQWKVTMDVSWSQYPAFFWLDQAVVDMPNPNEQHKCTFGRGALKDGKDAAYDYNYKWYINAWDVDESVPVDGPSYNPPAPYVGAGGEHAHTNGTQPPPDMRAVSIERQVAFKGAIELVTSRFIEPGEVGKWTDYFYSCIAGTHIVEDAPVVEEEDVLSI